ncbi:glutamine cyclotransferase [Bacteroidota bacterium]|nr:glutamine cyclotransferase [Bacteroidota bacterium]
MKSEVRIFIAIIFIGNFVAQFSSCSSCNNPKPVTVDTTKPKPVVTVHVPEFDADSSYRYCDVQVKFGPRIPGTKSQQQCAAYLEKMLKRYCDTVYVQKANVKVYDGTEKPMINLIGSFNPKAKKRILLLAHWDTRPWSDRDANEPKKQFDGADDGGSGVGILIECAEQFQKQKPNVGVDILLCDVEDYGPPEFESKWDETDQYALGTQYWANHPHAKNYRAFYGILLDMAGAVNARFPKEAFSMKYAPTVVNEFWNHAQSLGFGNYFVNENANAITDDHYYVNTINGTPTIDIINLSNETKTGFASHWHAQSDKMDLIDRATMTAVGQTLLQMIYYEPGDDNI